MYNGEGTCINEEGFEITHKDFNDVIITVPDKFAREGSFACKKGDIDMIKNCPYHPTEISNNISTNNSGNGLGTTTKGISGPAPVAAIVAPIAAIVLIIIIIGIVWYRRRRSEGRKRPKKSTIYTGVPPVIANGKCDKPFLGKENTAIHVEQTQIGCASVDYMDVLMGTNNPTNRDNVLTVNEQTANVTQEPSSSDNPVSGDSSGLQKTEYLSSKTSLSRSDGSDTPFLSTKFN